MWPSLNSPIPYSTTTPPPPASFPSPSPFFSSFPPIPSATSATKFIFDYPLPFVFNRESLLYNQFSLQDPSCHILSLLPYFLFLITPSLRIPLLLFLPLSQLIHFLSKKCPFSYKWHLLLTSDLRSSKFDTRTYILRSFSLDPLLIVSIALCFVLMALNPTMALVLPFFKKNPHPPVDQTISLQLTALFFPVLCIAVIPLLCHLSFSLT